MDEIARDRHWLGSRGPMTSFLKSSQDEIASFITTTSFRSHEIPAAE